MKQYKGRLYTLSLLQLFISVGALASGIGFMIDPSGDSMNMPIYLLENSPFISYLIPGIFLFVIIGCGSLVGSFLSFRQRIQAGMYGLAAGFALLVWIIMQIYWIGMVSWLQPLYFGLGAAEVLLSSVIIHKMRDISTL